MVLVGLMSYELLFVMVEKVMQERDMRPVGIYYYLFSVGLVVGRP